jgi:phosphoglycerate dehydrogenase-like enzyme
LYAGIEREAERQGEEMTGTPLNVHFETGANARPSKTLTPQLAEAAIGRYPGLLERVRMTFNADPARTDDLLAEAEVLMVTGPVDLEGLARRAPCLKWLQLASAGVDNALPHLPADVVLTNASGIHAERTQEIALMAFLMMNNHMPFFFHNQMRREWAQRLSAPIAGRTAVILGLGGLGAAVAAAARQLRLRTLGLSRSGMPHENVDESYTMDRLHEVLARADFLVITLPLTRETHRIVDAAALDCMPPHAQLLNIGRGPVLDVEHLARKLSAGELAGAMLDVFDTEPLPADSPLWGIPNLVITPHCWLDRPHDYAKLALEAFAEDLDNFVHGRPLLRRVEPALGY